MEVETVGTLGAPQCFPVQGITTQLLVYVFISCDTTMCVQMSQRN